MDELREALRLKELECQSLHRKLLICKFLAATASATLGLFISVYYGG